MPRSPVEPIGIAPVEVLSQLQPNLAGSGPGSQSPDSFLQEFRESRRIVEDIQRGTLEHTFFTKGHPNEAYLDSGLTGLEIGNPHPWWGSSETAQNDIAKDMYLIRREFTKLTDRADLDNRWTKIVLLYQRRTCPWSYEEERQTGSTTMQVWWGRDPDNPTLPALINVGAGYPVQVPQLMLRRHWPRTQMDVTAVEALDDLQNTTNAEDFAGQPAGVWLLESIQSKRLYGSGSIQSDIIRSNDFYELTVTWRGDPQRHHENWVAKFAAAVPMTPTGLTFNELAVVHIRTVLYPSAPPNAFDSIVGTTPRCNRVGG